MAISVGGPSGKAVTPQMNVTPLVDVVLVLLIIFLVVTPLLSKNFWVHLPEQKKEEVPPDQPPDPEPPLVLRVGADRTLQVNGTAVTLEELPERLKRMFAARDDHILFFDAADDADYGFAVSALDQARDGGAVTIAPLTKTIGSAAPEAGAPADGAAPPPDGAAAPPPDAAPAPEAPPPG
jgi:biopolymer transport protein ExbD/biopolymer transport protein TolR